MTLAIPRRSRRARAALAAAALAAAFTTALASGVPESLSKLKGSSDSSAAEAMARAGYQLQNTKDSWDRKDSFWWREKNRQCLRVTSRFNFVTGVALVGPDDCALGPAGIVPGRPGAFTANDVLGLSRRSGEARLNAAGFIPIWVDEGKPEGVLMLWFNQRTGQCIAATVVGDRFDVASDEPRSRCR